MYVPRFPEECAAFTLRVADPSETSLPLPSNYTAFIIKVKTVLPQGRPERPHKDRVPIFGVGGRVACTVGICTVLNKC